MRRRIFAIAASLAGSIPLPYITPARYQDALFECERWLASGLLDRAAPGIYRISGMTGDFWKRVVNMSDSSHIEPQEDS